MSDATILLKGLTDAARRAARGLARADEGVRNNALLAAAKALRARTDEIVAANARDLAGLSADRNAAFRDLLTLTSGRRSG
mgnify:FL=1